MFPIRVSGGVSPNMALGSMPTRPALLIRLTDSDGCFGWGEIWANFPPRANLHKAHLVEDVVAPKLINCRFTEPSEIEEKLRAELAVYFLHVGQQQVFEHILAGIDIALWDLSLRKANQSFASFMKLSTSKAPTYASSINISDLDRLIPHHAQLGQSHFKIKIGYLNETDRTLVERAASILPTDTRIMIDSNQSWTLDEAKVALSSLEKFNPLFAEESLPANAPSPEWEALAKSTSIPLAGGENIYGQDNFIAMANAGLKFLQPDVAKWGGVTGALNLASALPTGCVVWPHFMGTAVGQMAALCVTAAIGDNAVCEMDVNDNRLRTELCGDALSIDEGFVHLESSAGLVCEPDESCLQEFAEI